jgi:FtsH-binding integral membrane protein
MLNEHSNLRQEQSKAIEEAQVTYMSKVYSWMMAGLAVTGITAYFVYSSDFIYNLNGTIMLVLIIAQFGLVLGISGMINRMSALTAQMLFLLYSLLTGITFSTIFAVYSASSISNTFFITAGAFAGLSAFGFLTKKDLSAIGRFLYMALFGLIIASLVNMFVGSGMFEFLISAAGVVIFSGLTAYDTQKIKEMYLLQEQGEEIAAKGAILGALTLYLDFVNLFLFLLRFLGGSRD